MPYWIYTIKSVAVILFILHISMLRRGLVKCSCLFFIVFLMCPRRIRPTAPKQHDYFHALKRSPKDVNVKFGPSPKDVLDVNVKFGPDNSSNIVRQNVEGKLHDENEVGFDLSDDEIRKFKLWPKGIIPYYIDVVSFSDKVLRDHIRTFLNGVQRKTRLSFLEMPTPPQDDKTRWVFFVNRRGQLGCSDHSVLNFTNEGVQHVNLGYDCIWTGGELAEAVLSIVGVPSQHNSPDRDQYIKVIEENIIPEKRYLFRKLTDDRWLFHDLKYDFTSAGHFHHHKHSAAGRATIEFRNPHSISFLEENVGLSLSDLKKLRMLYNYIVMKKENKVPECDKLFRKGHNFNRYPRLTIGYLDPKPRKKPNKYLGLPEEHHEKELLQHRSHEDRNHEKDTGEGGASNSESTSEDRSDKANHNNDEELPAPRKLDLKSQPAKDKHKTYKIDLLSYLSDYQTGDEHRRKAVHNKTLKGNKEMHK